MLDSYDNLQTAVKKWLGGRTDLDDQIPDFIALAEARIRRRVRRRSIRATITISSAETTLPADCAELRSLRLSSSIPSLDRPMDVGSIEQLSAVRARHNAVPGRPIRAAVLGDKLLVAPAPDQPYTAEIVYFEKLLPLSATVQSNSVLADAPDLYLYGALCEAAPYLEHDERIPVWDSRVEKTMAELDAAREREEFNASLTPVRLPVRF